MLEQDRPRREDDHGPGPRGLGTMFADDGGVGMVTVSHGLHQEQLPVGQMSVAAIRERLGDRLELGPTARAQVDGIDATDDTIVRPGQHLMFVHSAGEKGR